MKLGRLLTVGLAFCTGVLAQATWDIAAATFGVLVLLLWVLAGLLATKCFKATGDDHCPYCDAALPDEEVESCWWCEESLV